MPTNKRVKKVKPKAFIGWDPARFHINFPNGNHLSTIWGEGSYSEEYHSSAMTNYLLKRTTERPVFRSDTVEIMFDAPDELKKKILKKYNEGREDPIGNLTLDKWLEIVKLLASPPSKGKVNKKMR